MLFLTSSFFRFLSKLQIAFLDFFILKIELRKFKKLNKITYNQRISITTLKQYDVIICFGFSIRDISDKQIEVLAGKCDKFIIHLSHYHLYANKLKYWSSFENVIFCADADIRNNYFFNFFIDKRPPFFVLTYIINNRFNISKEWKNRTSKIISTGTFHEFEKIYSIKQLISNPLSGIFGTLSLHPERRVIAKYADKLPLLESKNSSMGTLKIFTLFKEKKKVNQSQYFAFDIVELYNEFQYAFVGEETITGLPGIGIFEATICGCTPIINRACYNGTPFENMTDSIEYSNINELINIIKYPSNFSVLDDRNKRISLSTKLKEFYSPSFQLNILETFLSKS